MVGVLRNTPLQKFGEIIDGLRRYVNSLTYRGIPNMGETCGQRNTHQMSNREKERMYAPFITDVHMDFNNF